LLLKICLKEKAATRIKIKVEKYFIRQTNNTDVVIGGVSALRDFSNTMISVATRAGMVTVHGQKLRIGRFDENEIEINGRIENVETSSTKRSV